MNDTILWYATRGAGATTLVLLTGVILLGILSVRRFEAAGWPRFLTTGLHRNLALLALIFLGIHIVTAITDPYTHLGLAALVPFASSYRTLWLGLGAVALDLLLALILTSLMRRVIGRRAWRAVHWLAYLCWPVAVLHGLGTGTDAFSPWLLALQGLCAAAVVAAVVARLASRRRDRLAAGRAGFRVRMTREPER